MKRVILFLASLLLSATVYATDCEKANTQLESNECYNSQYQKDDQMLNETYKKVLSLATPEQQDLLRQAQLAWIKVRDADCKFVSSGSEGGTVAPMIHSICLSDRTKERTAFLESLTQCEEGDMSCPLPPQQN